MKEIGEALKYYHSCYGKHRFDVPCIGISSWGYTSENQQLNKDKSQKDSFEYENNVSHSRYIPRYRNRILNHSIPLVSCLTFRSNFYFSSKIKFRREVINILLKPITLERIHPENAF